MVVLSESNSLDSNKSLSVFTKKGVLAMTFDVLIAEVRRLAEESPDALYRGPLGTYGVRTCSYTQGECGVGVGCILGQAAKNVWPELFKEMKKHDHTGIGEMLVDNKSVAAYFRCDDNKSKLQWLKTVQINQDGPFSARTWRESVLIADTYHPLS